MTDAVQVIDEKESQDDEEDEEEEEEEVRCLAFSNFFAVLIQGQTAPNGIRITARCHFTGPKKVSISMA
jgi:hypothetical protein